MDRFRVPRRAILFSAAAWAAAPRLLRAQADDPERAMWLALKRALAQGGHDYFEVKMKDREIPRLKGKIASVAISDNQSVIRLVMSGAAAPEVTLTVHHANAKFRARPPAGAEIEFVGVVHEFTESPSCSLSRLRSAK